MRDPDTLMQDPNKPKPRETNETPFLGKMVKDPDRTMQDPVEVIQRQDPEAGGPWQVGFSQSPDPGGRVKIQMFIFIERGGPISIAMELPGSSICPSQPALFENSEKYL